MRFKLITLGILLSQSLVVHASEAAKSEEFWLWLSEYSDEEGELLDPLMLDEVLSQEYQQTEKENRPRQSPALPADVLQALEDINNEPSPQVTEEESL